jgi:hypothetical protein
VEKELKDPLQYLQEKFGNRPTVLAYPYGDFNQTVLKQTKEAGYALAFTVNPGPNDRTVPSLKLRRNLVLYPLGHKGFEKMFESRVLHLGNLSPDDGEVISSHKPLLKVQVKDEIDPKTIDLQLGDHQTNFQYDPKTHLLQHGFEVSLKAGGHMLMLAATDLHGQKRVYTWFFRIKYKHLTKEKEEK